MDSLQWPEWTEDQTEVSLLRAVAVVPHGAPRAGPGPLDLPPL